MIKIVIDNQQIEVEKNTTILHAAQKVGIRIPTLCHHPAIEPYGACRLCLVEVIVGKRTRVVTACAYPIESEIRVVTNSDKIISARRFVLALLLARCPESEKNREIASEYNITE